MRDLERNLKALASGRRLAILLYLKKVKSASVGDIAAEIRLSFKSTSRHLSILTGAGILEKKQVGLEVQHSISQHRHSIATSVINLV